MNVLWFLVSFVTLSFCHNLFEVFENIGETDEILQMREMVKEAIKEHEKEKIIDPHAPYTDITLLRGKKLEQPHLKISSTELVLNPRLISDFDDPFSNGDTLLYVKGPVRLEVFQRLQELGARPESIISVMKFLESKMFDYTREGLVENGLVEPQDAWAEAIDSGDSELFNYLLHESGTDTSRPIHCRLDRHAQHAIDFSVVGYCIFQGKIKFLKSLLSSGISPFSPPMVMPRQESFESISSYFKHVFDDDGLLAAALEPYMETFKEWDTSRFTILDLFATIPDGKVPVKTVELLLRHIFPCKYPLAWAILYGRPEAVRPLLRSNPDELIPPFNPLISLLLLSKNNFAQEISELLERGVVLRIYVNAITNAKELQTHQYLRPEHFLVAARHLILTGKAAPGDFIFDAIRNDNFPLFSFLLEQDADPHQNMGRSGHGSEAYTALGLSVYLDRPEMVQLMLARPGVDLDASHCETNRNFWDILMIKRMEFITSLFANVPTLLDSLVWSLLKKKALRSFRPSFVPEFISLLLKRVADPSFPLEAYKQTNGAGWTILDLIAFHDLFSSHVTADLIRTLQNAGIPTNYPLMIAFQFFEPVELLNLILDPSINPNERSPHLKRPILLHLLHPRRISEIVALVRRGARLDESKGELTEVRLAIKFFPRDSLVRLMNQLSAIYAKSETCNNLIELITNFLYGW